MSAISDKDSSRTPNALIQSDVKSLGGKSLSYSTMSLQELYDEVTHISRIINGANNRLEKVCKIILDAKSQEPK